MTNTQRMTQLTLLSAMCGLLACNKVNFSKVPDEVQQAAELPPIVKDPGPSTPPSVVTPPVVVTPPAAKLSNGDCADNSSTALLSCMKCEVPTNPPPPPQFSAKGLALIDGLAMGCSIRNGSDPAGYVPPTRSQLVARLNRASKVFYPDSAMTDFQQSVINGLVSTTDDSMRKRLFGGLFYRPPYSDAFETYFGVSIAEVRYTFCYDSPSANFHQYTTSKLISKSFMDCSYSGFGCSESPEYINGNIYRNQLRTTMIQSLSNPYVAPAPTAAKKCKWEKYEGEYDSVAQTKIREWLAKNYKVGIAVESLAGRCEGVTGVDSTLRGQVAISGYYCQ